MPSLATRPKTTTRPTTTARRAHPPAPPSLHALCAMFEEVDVADIHHARVMAERAVARVRASGPSVDGYGPHSLAIYEDIRRAAETGTYRAAVAQAYHADPGNLEGALTNAFGQPAFLAGLCCAWLLLTDGR